MEMMLKGNYYVLIFSNNFMIGLKLTRLHVQVCEMFFVCKLSKIHISYTYVS